MKLVKTGIAGLDEFLMGGLPSTNHTAEWIPGSGSEIFARQVLFNKMKHGTGAVTYFTVNASAESVREDMAAYGWDTTPFEEAGTWTFKSLQTATATALQENVLEEMKKQRTVAIDSISELLITHKIKEIVSLIASMSHQNIKNRECHFLFSTEGMQDLQAETAMNHFAEGSINFAIVWKADSTLRKPGHSKALRNNCTYKKTNLHFGSERHHNRNSYQNNITKQLRQKHLSQNS